MSVPVVLDAMIEQVSRASVDPSLQAAAQAADQDAAAAAALEAALASNTSRGAVDGDRALEPQPQGKKIIYEGDAVASAAAGIATGALTCLLACMPCPRVEFQSCH